MTLTAQIYDRLSSLVVSSGWRRGKGAPPPAPDALIEAARTLPGLQSETRGMAVAAEILAGYAALDDLGKRAFFEGLRDGFDPDHAALTKAARWQMLGPTGSLNSLRAISMPRPTAVRRSTLEPISRQAGWPLLRSSRT